MRLAEPLSDSIFHDRRLHDRQMRDGRERMPLTVVEICDVLRALATR